MFFIRDQCTLKRLIQQNPLIDRSSTRLAGILPAPQLFFGVGLCNRRMLSTGFPVDVLELILVSELVGAVKHVLIADLHAGLNGFDAVEINLIAQRWRNILHRLIANLGLSNWEIHMASEISHCKEYRKAFDLVSDDNEYVRQELADMMWFWRVLGIRLKVGWALNGSADSSETAFDQKFQRHVSVPLNFLYLVPGRTFDPKRPRASPYFCENPDARVLLDCGEDVAHKIAQARGMFGTTAVNAYINFLNDLARLFDKVTGLLEKGPIEQRIQQMLERCLL